MKHRLKVLSIIFALLLVFASVQAQEDTVVDIAVGNESTSTLVTAVQAAGLVEVLADTEAEWTVFAPTNEAFAALPDGLLDTLLADTELLTRVLTYHVVEGTVTSDMLSDMMAPSMEMSAVGADLVGSELDVQVGDDGTVTVNDATVIQADILASNGVVHVIDSVLVPPEVADMLMGDDMMMDDMMMDDMMMMDATLFATLNPSELENDAIVTVSTNMGMMDDEMMDESEEMDDADEMMDDMSMQEIWFNGFEEIASIQSVKFTSDNTAYVTVDVAEGEGGIAVVDGMGMDMRMIGGTDAAGLVSPKGLEIIEELDLVLVANFGASNIKGFSLDAEGDATPTVFIDDLAEVGGSIWDVHYDADTDTLFAAGTTGTLFLFSNFSEDLGANGPSSTIVPSDAEGNPISINLHGVEYDAMSDTVILADVGAADSNTDGQLFTISSASEVSGNVTVDLQIGGPESQLGNPVDIVFDGSGIYVAEKANDLILYYADILGGMGMMDSTADEIIEISKPESVTLVASMEDM